MANYVCPHCHKEVKHLNDHIRRMHPDKLDNPEPEPDTQDNDADLDTGEGTIDIQEPEGADSAPYHCVDCGSPLTKGQTPCPKCGADLDWSAVK